MNHTPGPWKIVEGTICLHVESEDRSFSTGCLCFRDADPWANARLIAAAPELLGALKALRAQVPPYSLGSSILARVDEALFKAEGKVKV
mgnify:CR=1 FL=1